MEVSELTDKRLEELVRSPDLNMAARKLVAAEYLRRKSRPIRNLGGTNEKRVD